MKTNLIRKRCARLRAMLLGGLVLPVAGLAQDAAQEPNQAPNRNQVDLSQYSNNSFITLKGTVESVMPNTFVLSYNNNEERITVEMDDGDRDADAYQLLPGDEVTVYGMMDRDLFEMRKVEAGSVYVDKLNTFFRASAVDEEDYYYPLLTVVTMSPNNQSGTSVDTGSQASSTSSDMATGQPRLWLQGEVSNVQDDSFELALDDRAISVSVSELGDNPLDDEGYRKIENGDVVSVLGNIDGSFFDNAELEADSVVKIHDKEDL